MDLNKAGILNRNFFYGSDLQYSSQYDPGADLYNQSLAMGHIPVRFRIFGSELQLVADNRRLYPSNVNHPEQIISRYAITAETADLLTVSAADSSPYLAQMVQGGPQADGAALLSVSDHWVRSFDYVGETQHFLQQSSIVLADGNIVEFMESVFPADYLKTGSEFEAFKMDPTDPVGAQSGPAARFRFIGGEQNFNGEEAFAFAQHFDLSKTPANPTGTIDWYVTANIDDRYLAPVQLAVEGWNRYFRAYPAIGRNVMRFMGRLPEGIHLGDPRFNVINWDSRLIAGAAYESQASDPATGKQSHSLIYMPAAWVQIGFSYWQNGKYVDDGAHARQESVSASVLAGTHGPARAARIACLRDMRSAAAYLASGRVNADEVERFGIELLKQTLFHEVGHALGLAHNFEGSLAYDSSLPADQRIFASSIMDYSNYEMERQAFTDVNSSDGPQLSYDRQALDAIYNQSRDIAGEPVIATCNDEEADAQSGGVNPLCMRYDVNKDPTRWIDDAYNRLVQDQLPSDTTLAQALRQVPSLALADNQLAPVKTVSDFDGLVSSLTRSLEGPLRFYITSGTAAYSRAVRANYKSLLEFGDGVLPSAAPGAPEYYDQLAMRERAYRGITQALAMRALPLAVQTELTHLLDVTATDGVAVFLRQTPFVAGLAAADATNAITAALAQISDDIADFTGKRDASIFVTLHSAVFQTLTRHKTVDLFFSQGAGVPAGLQNVEMSLISILSDAIQDKANHAASERLAAAKSLMTFAKHADQAEPTIAATLLALKQEQAVAQDNASRKLANQLIYLLEGNQA